MNPFAWFWNWIKSFFKSKDQKTTEISNEKSVDGVSDIQKKFDEEKAELNQQIGKLEAELQFLKDKGKELIIAEFKQSEEYSKKVEQLTLLNQQAQEFEEKKQEAIAGAVNKAKLDFLKEYEEENKKKDGVIQGLTIENEALGKKVEHLTNNKYLGSQKMGAEFEEECQKMLDEVCSGATLCSYERDKKGNSGNEKADFVFKYLDSSKKVYSSITIECKTESSATEKTNEKNRDHIPKLVKDAEKNSSFAAILVTTKEKDDILLVRSIPNPVAQSKVDVYMCRPEYLVSILKMYLKIHKEELKIHSYKDMSIKSEFLDEFIEWKDRVQKLHFLKMEKICGDSANTLVNIQNLSRKIDASAKGLEEELKQTLVKHMESLSEKFEKFTPKLKKSHEQLMTKGLLEKSIPEEPVKSKT